MGSAIAPQEKVGRLAWVDALRVTAIAGVIVVHTATAYVADFADWYYDDELSPTTWGTVVFALPALLGGIFGLGPLFWLAGWFSVPSLGRRGPGPFAAARLVRLGLPLVVFVVLVNPLADLVGNMRQKRRSFLDYLGETEFSVMWFVATLLVCSLGYASLRAIRPVPSRSSPPGPASMLVAGLLLGVLSILIWPTTSLLDERLMSVRLGAWMQGVILFALGVMAGEAASDAPTGSVDPGVGRVAQRRWGWITLGGSAAIVGVMGSITATGELDDALRQMPWQGVVFALLYGLVSMSFSLWCLSWFARSWTTRRPWMERAGRASYATYVFHPLVLTSVMVALARVPGPAAAKFLLVVALGVPVCFAAGYALTRLPAVGRLL